MNHQSRWTRTYVTKIVVLVVILLISLQYLINVVVFRRNESIVFLKILDSSVENMMNQTGLNLKWRMRENVTKIEKPLDLCPVIPPKLKGHIKVNAQVAAWAFIERENAVLSPGGRYKPPDCQARHRVAIVIPYRDREIHLKIFLMNIHPFLQRQQLDYGIFVVEMTQGIKFNRALLMNVGFVEAMKQYDYQCFIFHDVDLLPEDDRNLYTCPQFPRHMSVAIDRLQYKLPYTQIFGGVSAMTKEHFKKINGFSNIFFGWGGEDDDMYRRILYSNLTVIRYSPEVARYKMLIHAKENGNTDRFMLLRTVKARRKTDGITSLKYKTEKIELRPLYTWILISANETEIIEAEPIHKLAEMNLRRRKVVQTADKKQPNKGKIDQPEGSKGVNQGKVVQTAGKMPVQHAKIVQTKDKNQSNQGKVVPPEDKKQVNQDKLASTDSKGSDKQANANVKQVEKSDKKQPNKGKIDQLDGNKGVNQGKLVQHAGKMPVQHANVVQTEDKKQSNQEKVVPPEDKKQVKQEKVASTDNKDSGKQVIANVKQVEKSVDKNNHVIIKEPARENQIKTNVKKKPADTPKQKQKVLLNSLVKRTKVKKVSWIPAEFKGILPIKLTKFEPLPNMVPTQVLKKKVKQHRLAKRKSVTRPHIQKRSQKNVAKSVKTVDKTNGVNNKVSQHTDTGKTGGNDNIKVKGNKDLGNIRESKNQSVPNGNPKNVAKTAGEQIHSIKEAS